MRAPQGFVEHLRTNGYHPRSSKHGDALCNLILSDLIEFCPKIRQHATTGQLVYEFKQTIYGGGSDWNIDLVLGPPPAGYKADDTPRTIAKQMPATFRIAVEAKTVMTEHGKARRNRQRDLDQFQEFIRRYDANTVSAAVTVVNISERFQSPLRRDETRHNNVVRLVTETVGMFRAIPTRSAPDQKGLDANAVIVVDHDNITNTATKLVTRPPAPQTGDPLEYHSFLQRICDRYTQRW